MVNFLSVSGGSPSALGIRHNFRVKLRCICQIGGWFIGEERKEELSVRGYAQMRLLEYNSVILNREKKV